MSLSDGHIPVGLSNYVGRSPAAHAVEFIAKGRHERPCIAQALAHRSRFTTDLGIR